MPLATYLAVSKVISEVQGEDTHTADVTILAALCETTVDEIWSLTLPEYSELLVSVSWIKEFDIDYKKPVGLFKTLKITSPVETRKYKLTSDIADITTGQFIDF